MIFGEMTLAEAEGAILAHSVKHGGGVFKKGRVLSAADIAMLNAAAIRTVFAARLSPGDVAEDRAAAQVAQAVAGPGTRAQAAFTGRANLHAAARGVAIVDGPRVTALNHLHESLTLATVTPFAIVDQREMVATVKVIPFAVPGSVLDSALAIAAGGPLVRVAAFSGRSVGLVITRLPQTKPGLLSKSEAAMRERVSALDGQLDHVQVVDHAIAPVAAAIAELRARGAELVLLFGASAIVDRGDVIPSAVTAAGGEVLHLGMPVDPGNLMMLGRAGGAPVIGVPSCARSPKMNGFDWVLARLMAGVPVTAEDVMDMGPGGLLAEIPTRPAPREGRPTAQRAPRVTALVLAAGQSSRMGSNKLLADVGGVPLIRRSVAALQTPLLDEVIVVTGRDSDHVAVALKDLPATLVHNPDFAHGLSTSLRRGLTAVSADTDAVLICLGDMPMVDAGVVARLIAAFSPAEHRSICIPLHQGQRGNPVLWGRSHIPSLAALTGDRGARALFDRLADEVVEVEMPDRAVLLDIDTPEALADFRSGRAP